MKIWRGEKIWNAIVIKVITPDGTAILIINEDDKNNPQSFDLMIGKAGSSIRAWAYALGKALTLAVEHGATIEEIISDLSNTHSDRVTYSNGMIVRSGIDGLVKALMKYQSDRFIKMTGYLSDVPSFGGI